MNTDRAHAIAALKSVPAFQAFVEEVNDLTEKYHGALASKMMSTGEPFPDFEYKRGYLAGLRMAADYPDQAVKKLRRDIERSHTQEEEVA